MKPSGFIIVYEDDVGGHTIPFTWDGSCDGAVCCSCSGDHVAMFPDRKAAQKAIRISTAYARLCEAQGRSVNTDFTTSAKCIKIVPLMARKDERNGLATF